MIPILTSYITRKAMNMRKIRVFGSKKGYLLWEMLFGLAFSAVIITFCAQASMSVIKNVSSLSVKMSADALAASEAQYIKDRLRFSADPNETIASLEGYEAELNGLSSENLSFELLPDGVVSFCFCVAGYEYEYKAAPLNLPFSESEKP